MSAAENDQYLHRILNKFAVSQADVEPAAHNVAPHLREWAGSYLYNLSYSGSLSKGTAVSNGTDVDLFISLFSTCPNTLKELYDSLFSFMQHKGFAIRRQNVSIGVGSLGKAVDLVPAKRQGNHGDDHSLYVSKLNTWTKTNVEKHASVVSGSGRQEEIRALKIWRNQKGFDFPSFYLELATIEALKGARHGNLSANVVTALKFLRDNFRSRRFIDPANTNNVISETLSESEKMIIANQASDALNGTWSQFIS